MGGMVTRPKTVISGFDATHFILRLTLVFEKSPALQEL